MIYCVEDDKSIRELIIYALNSGGLEAKGFESADEFYEELRNEIPSLVLLDIMLPGEDGISILKELKSEKKTMDIPVIMLTAKSSEYDKVFGLDLGADDYITKPFGVMELLSRIKAVLRRTNKIKEPREIKIGNILLDTERHRVMVSGEEVTLTFKEFELLRYLMENSGIVLTRDRLLSRIWGYDFDGETRTVDVHIRSLRQKLREAGNQIETVRSVGYRMGG